MAKPGPMTYPLDQPAIVPGAVRESDAPGAEKWLHEEPSSPARRAKGDLGMEHIADFEPRPLSHPGAPFGNLKGGR
jgi:hypothetical protein